MWGFNVLPCKTSFTIACTLGIEWPCAIAVSINKCAAQHLQAAGRADQERGFLRSLVEAHRRYTSRKDVLLTAKVVSQYQPQARKVSEHVVIPCV